MQDPTEATTKPCPLQESPMGNTRRLEEVSLQRHQEKVEMYRKIHELHAKKVHQGIIAQLVGTSRQTVTRSIHMDQPPERRTPRRTRTHLLEPFKPYLIERWNEGVRNASELFRELKARGYTASMSNVSRFLKNLRTTKGKPRGFKQVEPTEDNHCDQKRCAGAASADRAPSGAVDDRNLGAATGLAKCLSDAPVRSCLDDRSDFREGTRLCNHAKGAAGNKVRRLARAD